MRLSKLYKGLFVVVLLIVLAACGSNSSGEENGEKEAEAQAGGELKIAYPAQPQTLDPQISLAQATVDIMGNVYESLLTVDSNYGVQPMLAESYEQSEDGKTITFKLREGVLFHNGEEMIADDVVASMNRWKDELGGRDQFNNAVFEKEDDYTVVLKLEEPLSTALSILAFGGPSFAAVMPAEIVENASSTGVEEFIGTGPYEFVEWKHDQSVHLTKFLDYQPLEEAADGLAGKKEALLDDIEFIFTPDSSTRMAGIQTGEFDLAPISFDNLDQIEKGNQNVNTLLNEAGYFTFTFNKSKGMFTDHKAREAVAMALDHQAILKGAVTNEDFYTVDHSMMMSHQQDEWPSDIGKDIYANNNPEEAKNLLEEAGYAGEEITIIVSRDYEYQYNSAVVLQSQLEAIGLKVNLEVYDWPTLLDLTEDENAYDIYVLTDLIVPEPTSNLYLLPGFAGWTDSQELEGIIDDFRGRTSLEEAKESYDELVEWYFDYIPIIKVGDYKDVIAVQDSVENFQHHDRYILWNVTKSN